MPPGQTFCTTVFYSVTLHNLRFDMWHDYVCTTWILDPSGPHPPGPAHRGHIKIPNMFLQSSSIGLSPLKVSRFYLNGLRAMVWHYRRTESWPRWLSWMCRPTGDQEVAGSTPAEVGNILSWRLIMKYFLRSFSPFRWFKKGSCQFVAKECAQYWLTA